jgi:KDO2-lipid IV(A) lauroyltransferase
VVIGINDYAHPRVPKLRYAVNDARSIEAALLGQEFRRDRVIALLDAQATKSRIETVLGDELRQKVGGNDRVFVFFAGHGKTDRLRSGEDATPAARAALVDDVFRHFAMCFSDLATANRGGRRERLLGTVEGEHHLAAAERDGRGAVVRTAHLGNWELAGRLMALRVGRPTQVMMAPEADPRVERFRGGGPASVRFVPRDEPRAALPLVAALRRGGVVAMQGDRALGTRGDFGVSFFDAEAHFPLGPFVRARASGAPVVPAFCVLDHDRRYTVRVDKPVRVEADGERAVLERWVAVLERAVRAHPEQWFNFYDVWSPVAAR